MAGICIKYFCNLKLIQRNFVSQEQFVQVFELIPVHYCEKTTNVIHKSRQFGGRFSADLFDSMEIHSFRCLLESRF